MKNYRLYIFTQHGCKPCEKLAAHLDTLPPEQVKELTIVPMRTFNKQRTALAQELKVDKSPTLVVAHGQVTCSMEQGEDEWCDSFEVPVETIVGAKAIIKALPDTLHSYTYINPE